MGRLVANNSGGTIDTIASEYGLLVRRVFARQAKYKSAINVFEHIFGSVSSELSKAERTYFLNLIEEYRDERIPRTSISTLLYSWAVRFNKEYLLDQVLFDPFPIELVQLADSGKGRD